MCVVSLPCCPQGPQKWAQFTSRTWKLAHAHSHYMHMWTYIVYTLLIHAHKHTHMSTSKYTLTLHLLTQSQSHSIQSLLTHQSSQDWLRFQGVLLANSNHNEGDRILLFAYCPNSNPKAGTQG